MPPPTADASGDVSASCTDGAKRCTGQKAQACQGGHYVDLFSCPSDQVCEAGVCKAGTTQGDVTVETTSAEVGPDTDASPACSCVDKECGDDGCGGTCGTCTGNTHCESSLCVSGTTCTPQCNGKQCGPNGCGGQCGGCDTGETCQGGQCVGGNDCNCNGAKCGLDNCGNTCGFCPGGTECDNSGQCVANTTGDSCQGILDCITSPTECGAITDPDAWNACANACVAAGSATGQTEFDDYLGCLNTCPAEDDGSCALQNCLQVEVACRFDDSGFGTCFDIQDCLGMCGDSDIDCIYGCYEMGSTDAQEGFLGLNKCMNLECGPDNPSPDPDCMSDTTLPAACMPYLNMCQ